MRAWRAGMRCRGGLRSCSQMLPSPRQVGHPRRGCWPPQPLVQGCGSAGMGWLVTPKLLPQLQDLSAFGLRNLKPPSINASLFGTEGQDAAA